MPGTITGSAEKIHDIWGTLKFIKVTLTCTADSGDNSYPETVINDLITEKLEGLYLLTVGTTPGSPAPTDATDLAIEQDSVDLLDTKGVDLIDATTSEITWAGSSGQDFGAPVVGDLTAVISNNSVASAVTTIILIFAI